MTGQANYGVPHKLFHWAIVALLAIQYPIGWLMPDIHRGQQPGTPMTLHVSFGLLIMVLMLLRLGWRLSHPVAPEPSLPRWQRLASESVHRLLYALVIATTLTGWLFASFRGWSLSFFFLAPLPMLAGDNAAAGKFINGWHQWLEWSLLITLAVHVGAALLHRFYYRDGVLQRMLPGPG